MEYESDRTLIETKLEEVKRLALLEAAESTTFVASEPDPKWVKPAPQPTLPAVGIEEAQGFWINGGKIGSNKDEQIEAPRNFDHDLPSLLKDGPTDLPNGEWAESKLTPAEIEERMKAYGPTDEDLANLLNTTVLEMSKKMESGLYSKENLIKLYKSGLRSE